MDDATMKRIPRLLDGVERRVLGALLEKEQATPEYYPLTVNALVAACNQRSNREPVMELTAPEVEATLARLLPDVLVWRTEGARTLRWRHNVERRWRLDAGGKAIVTLLLLRGPQTPGELRSRSDRLHPFLDLGEVQAALADLAAGPEPLVRELPRGPGQKEARWTDLLSEEAPAAAPAPSPAPAETPPAAADGLDQRLARLEARVDALAGLVTRLAASLGEPADP